MVGGHGGFWKHLGIWLSGIGGGGGGGGAGGGRGGQEERRGREEEEIKQPHLEGWGTSFVEPDASGDVESELNII